MIRTPNRSRSPMDPRQLSKELWQTSFPKNLDSNLAVPGGEGSPLPPRVQNFEFWGSREVSQENTEESEAPHEVFQWAPETFQLRMLPNDSRSSGRPACIGYDQSLYNELGIPKSAATPPAVAPGLNRSNSADVRTPDRHPELPVYRPPVSRLDGSELEGGQCLARSTSQINGGAVSTNLANPNIPQSVNTVVEQQEPLKEHGDEAGPSSTVSGSRFQSETGLLAPLSSRRKSEPSLEDDVLDTEGIPKPTESGQTISDIVPPLGHRHPFQISTEGFWAPPWHSPLSTILLRADNGTRSAPPQRNASSTNDDKEEMVEAKAYASTRPTCSINLVCYRSGAAGCKLAQVQVAKASRFKDDAAFQKALAKNPDWIVSDAQFLEKVRDVYRHQMCNVWRRALSLKSLREMKLLSYTSDRRPTVVDLDSFVLKELLYAFNHPSQIRTETVWIDWVFRLRQPDKRHALEFVEGWNGTRVAIAGMIPLVFSTVVGLAWSMKSGDWQTAFTVAGFILTAGTLMLALLAIISSIEASGKAGT